MISKLYNSIFGCHHNHYSFPITPRSRSIRIPAARVTGTYVVCLKCAKELPYDWSEMKVVSLDSSKAAERNSVRTFAPKEAA